MDPEQEKISNFMAVIKELPEPNRASLKVFCVTLLKFAVDEAAHEQLSELFSPLFLCLHGDRTLHEIYMTQTVSSLIRFSPQFFQQQQFNTSRGGSATPEPLSPSQVLSPSVSQSGWIQVTGGGGVVVVYAALTLFVLHYSGLWAPHAACVQQPVLAVLCCAVLSPRCCRLPRYRRWPRCRGLKRNPTLLLQN